MYLKNKVKQWWLTIRKQFFKLYDTRPHTLGYTHQYTHTLQQVKQIKLVSGLAFSALFLR